MNLDIDAELKLLSGSSFFVDNIEIKPFTIREIVDIGYVKYSLCLNIFSLELKDMFDEIPEEFQNVNIFDILINSGVEDVVNNFLDAIRLFLRNDAELVGQEVWLNGDGEIKIIDRYNWEKICKIIKLQNCIDSEKEDYNPANDEAKRIAENFKKAKEKINKIKSKSDEDLNLSDLISAFAFYNKNTNLMDVFNMSMYQFNNQFQRMQIINDYEISIQSILHGADPQKVNIKHFASKI